MEANNYIVYIHQNKINGKMYCGQTCQDPQKRFKGGSGYSDCPRFYNAIKKYGWGNFNHIILIENLSHEMANIVETEIIKKYNLTNDKFGYNIDDGGAHPAPPINDLTGQTFGRLTVIGRDTNRSGIYWLCKCSCDQGNIVSVYNGSLKNGATRSCGCLKKEENKNNPKYLIHGMANSKLYTQWRNMLKRQDAKNNLYEPWYDFNVFHQWAKQTGYYDGQVVIRIDRNKMYSPDNCRWGTLKDYKKTLIKKNTKFYDYHGEQLTLNELSELTEIPINALAQRLRNNKFKDIDEILNLPYRYHNNTCRNKEGD